MEIKKPDPEYIQNALNHINWWRSNFGFESNVQKLYKATTLEEFSTSYSKFMTEIAQQNTGYREDSKFIDVLSKLSSKQIYTYCIELGYAENPNNYSYSLLNVFVPKSFTKKLKEIADADDSIVIYLTDLPWELSQRAQEQHGPPNTISRELRTVTNDSRAKYYNFIWKRFPCEIFDVKSALFEHVSNEYISVQIRHSKLGNHIHWLIQTLAGITGEL